jgi:Flp pilus assembly protein TadD
VLLATLFAYLPLSGADYSLSQTLQDGVNALNAGDLDTAEARFRDALRLGGGTGDEAVVHNNLGVVLARQGKLAEAERHFLAAVQLNHQYDDAQQNLSRLQEYLRVSRPTP